MDFEPRGAVADLFLDRSPEVALCGAAGTGKTVGALMKLHITSLKVRNVQSLIVRQTHASLTASTLLAFEQFVAAQEIASGEVRWFGGSGSKPPGYRYRNGSMIMVGGMDNPGKVLSMSLDRVLIDEANQVSVVAYETLLTRLRGSADTYKQMVCATNPDHPKHWLKEKADDDQQKMRMYTSYHRDNPYLAHRDGTLTTAGRDYMGFLDGLTGVRRGRYRDGLWLAAEGLVFSDWRDDVNLIDPFEVPDDWDCFWTVDFGYQNQFVWQCWRVDPDGRLYLTHELSHRQRLVEDHARWILAFVEQNGLPHPRAIVCDHDSEDRATLERHLKMSTIAAKKAVTRGVQLTEARIRPAGDGRPRLYVFRTAIQNTDPLAKSDNRPRGFAAEVNSYVWAMERGADGIPKEMPLKLNDHSCDAARYAVAHLDWNEESKLRNPARAQQGEQRSGSKWSRPVGR